MTDPTKETEIVLEAIQYPADPMSMQVDMLSFASGHIGAYTHEQMMRVDDNIITLPRIEHIILLSTALNIGKIVAYQALYSTIWDTDADKTAKRIVAAEHNSLKVQLSRLLHRMGTPYCEKDWRPIKTIRGVGLLACSTYEC